MNRLHRLLLALFPGGVKTFPPTRQAHVLIADCLEPLSPQPFDLMACQVSASGW